MSEILKPTPLILQISRKIGKNKIVPFKLPIILEKEKNRAMAMSSEIISGTHVSGYYNNGEPKTDIERDPGND